MGASRLAIAYWQQYIKDIKPCFLPTKDGTALDHYDVPASLEHVPIVFDSTKEVCETAENWALEPQEVIRTAWALLLHRYTDGDEVCFGVHHERLGEIVSSVCRLQIAPTDKTQDIYLAVRNDALNSYAYRTELFNHVLQAGNRPLLPDICNSAIIEIENTGSATPMDTIDVSLAQ